MTDEEILFDFLTVQETRKAELDSMAQDPENEEPVPAPTSVLPENPMDQNRSSSMQVTADRAEFIRWYEQEVGPWETLH
jgi:hypothetical protein